MESEELNTVITLVKILLKQDSIFWGTEGLTVVSTALHGAAVHDGLSHHDKWLKSNYIDVAFSLMDRGACALTPNSSLSQEQRDEIQTITKAAIVVFDDLTHGQQDSLKKVFFPE